MKLIQRIINRRMNRVRDLENEIEHLENARDGQADINARERHEHEDRLRRMKHEHEDEVLRFKREIEVLKAKAAAVDEETGHLMAIRDEKRTIELERTKVELERKKAEEINVIKAEYAAKVEKLLNEQIKKLDDQYAALLARLPNIDVALKGRVGG